ncbi:hypothetical protein D3C76_752540 [compost metagenome]
MNRESKRTLHAARRIPRAHQNAERSPKPHRHQIHQAALAVSKPINPLQLRPGCRGHELSRSVTDSQLRHQCSLDIGEAVRSIHPCPPLAIHFHPPRQHLFPVALLWFGALPMSGDGSVVTRRMPMLYFSINVGKRSSLLQQQSLRQATKHSQCPSP